MAEPKAIVIEEWVKKAKKFKKKYGSHTELVEASNKILGMDFYFIIEDPRKHILVVEPRNIFEGGRRHERIHQARDCPYYKIKDDNSLELIDAQAMIMDLLPFIKPHLDVDALLKDVLDDQPVGELLEIHERIVKPKDKRPAKIKQKPGCVYMQIGGKPGNTYDLFLRA